MAAEMRRREEREIFGTSFLDVISCGLGAVVLMIILSKDVDSENVTVTESIVQPSQISVPLDVNLKAEVDELLIEDKQLSTRLVSLSQRLNKTSAELAQLKDSLSVIKEQKSSKKIGTIDSKYNGGIPVSREYVIFIVDTSGSMKNNWAMVKKVMTEILDTYPKVKGMQIMNDNGNYLIDGYSKRWIPDTVSARKRALEKFDSWNSFSNSSPEEGLEIALKTYAQKKEKVSIYVMGDDYTGKSFETVINVVDRWNIDKSTGSRHAIIHGIGFPWGLGDRFSTLMRRVSSDNRGVFIAL